MEVIQVCPHGKKLKKIDFLGIISYSHEEDDKGCMLMNRVDVTQGAIGDEVFRQQIARNGFKKTPEIIAEIATLQTTRYMLYKMIASYEGKKLVDVLKEFMAMMSDIEFEQDIILKEFINTFGQNSVLNVKMVTGFDHSTLLDRKAKPVFQMKKLTYEDVQGIIGYTSKTTEEERLEDILGGL
jgi:hypothetical protein